VLLSIPPSMFEPGDQLALPDGYPEQVVDRLGDIVDDEALGRSRQVYFVGDDEPQVYPVAMSIGIIRADPAEE